MDFFKQIAGELQISPAQSRAVAELLDGGATVPFIARYRKEAHGSLDEVAITAVRDRLVQLRELDSRRQAILKSLEERELLSPELSEKVLAAPTLSELEDVYLPYRPKRRTRASIAREKGLEPLAFTLIEQSPSLDADKAATAFVDATKGVESVADALAGARDIIAESVSEDAAARAVMREFFARKAYAASTVNKGKDEEGAKFRDYFDWSEPVTKLAGHRLLAMLRGENEGYLTVHFLPAADSGQERLRRLFVKGAPPYKSGSAAAQVQLAVDDSYKRLLAPSLETELRASLREKAEGEAIAVFARNLRGLLLAPPLGQKRVLAIDPGFRTGCKVTCLDAQGALLHHDVIYIMSDDQQKKAADKLRSLCGEYGCEAIAVGNGTAGRESEALARSLKLGIPVISVSESGASVYSASEVARREFPDLDLTVRGAVSIGRRLMDPLAELVKIDPKAIGVGQYQHDVDQNKLKQALNDVVESCVNAVGVELNTASAELLSYVSGLGPALARAIVGWREENGGFTRREELKKVPRLGPKAFEQAAGFLRIRQAGGTGLAGPGDATDRAGGTSGAGGTGKVGAVARGSKKTRWNPLDASAVHPESYGIVERMAADLGCAVGELVAGTPEAAELRRKIKPENYVGGDVGMPTIKDILAELEKPGRDPRESFEVFAFAENVSSIDDLEPGMRLPGLVTNVTNFGAFVDIGVHQDGLVHISQLSDSFVSDPHNVVKVRQQVSVTVLEVDAKRKRIALSMKSGAGR
ncbi:RNA-binding transcriptional accessory protein [Desulfovibrio sp. OttesenSCG-928-C06]|nr:RNA-binding transcriptional accessory protein [Desulfovibrio sp. OttesenSCG-928-C06]